LWARQQTIPTIVAGICSAVDKDLESVDSASIVYSRLAVSTGDVVGCGRYKIGEQKREYLIEDRLRIEHVVRGYVDVI